ncbi:3-hydroxyacyl-CoA dehydrogenase [Nocardia donostiensis]|uniref:SDR family NAD(P)-dependent oxidoreductase n=1 Tax=Nocardia donostiensis TaxID=1538463 RepID=UPI0009DAEF64|nr:SDR family NAD(P)-dependent oxidoreductase [Nocardia donostiensis]OQS16166.1 3-hydroxyacyl-CoA dehydrogenase [Nocardia donostiensis]
MDLKNKVALVAGGASGLGRAVCADLTRHGAVVAVLDQDKAKAEEVVQELGGGLALAADVTDAAAIEDAVSQVVRELGALHLNVNTAGVLAAAKIVSRNGPASLEDFDRVIRVNLCGTFNVMRMAVAAMLNNELDNGERGVVVNTSSGAAYEGQTGQAAYAASKAGVIGFTLPVARDLAGSGIRVNAIAPGLFETPMSEGLPDRVHDGLVRMITEPRRLGQPSEFAHLVRSIVENRYLNGECIRLDAATRLGAH